MIPLSRVTTAPAKRGPKSRPIVEFPDANSNDWTDPPSFSDALALHLQRHGDSCWRLHKAVTRPDEKFDRKTLQQWAQGSKMPNSVQSFDMLARIERRYRLPERYFRGKLSETGCAPKMQGPERQLESLLRGELRWSNREEGWEVLIPSAAFKNAGSSFFAGKPFRLRLPDFDGLYGHIASYIERDRALLLGDADDPGTFFVKTVKRTSRDASYNSAAFYEAWRLLIQRFGIYNPYTGRGAIKGLLPHGPHNVRDVLATHILKQTGSYEQASYAIQDTPAMVAQHYGRFLPHDKAAIAARILNQVWESG